MAENVLFALILLISGVKSFSDFEGLSFETNEDSNDDFDDLPDYRDGLGDKELLDFMFSEGLVCLVSIFQAILTRLSQNARKTV